MTLNIDGTVSRNVRISQAHIISMRLKPLQSLRCNWLYSILFSLPHSGRVAILVDIIWHFHTRASIYELTLHFELAELCLNVSKCVHTHGYILYMDRRAWPYDCSHSLLERFCV